MHNGSLTHLVATLYNTKSITRNDLEELKRFIEERGNEERGNEERDKNV